MTKIINWLNEDIRRWVVGLFIGVSMMIVTFIITSFSTIAQGSRNGTEALQRYDKVDERVEVIESCNRNQLFINYRVSKDIEYIMKSLDKIEKTLDKIYERSH